MKRIAAYIIIALSVIAGSAYAQTRPSVTLVSARTIEESKQIKLDEANKKISDITVAYAVIDENGDTIITVNLPEMDISLMKQYQDMLDTRHGRRLVNNVRKVYPYAKEAGKLLAQYDELLVGMKSSKARRQLMKEAEDDITAKYSKELKKMTFSQGAILIRLIDRETGSSSFKVVQALRGKFRAAFYQGFARLWGYNLKTEFDPKTNKEDENIEIIITMIEKGWL